MAFLLVAADVMAPGAMDSIQGRDLDGEVEVLPSGPVPSLRTAHSLWASLASSVKWEEHHIPHRFVLRL